MALSINNISNIINTATDLQNALTAVKDKLLNNPNEASEKLADVIGELSHILEFVEKETVSFLEIIFLPDKSNFIECRSALLRLESGYVTIKGYEARGHCHKISNIYDKYLNRWFSKVLDPQEAQNLEINFDNMSNADFDMVDGIQDLTDWLKDESANILRMIDLDNIDGANDRIKGARLEIQLVRRDIVEALANLKLLQASFIASSQTV